jgi:hypothetical protein
VQSKEQSMWPELAFIHKNSLFLLTRVWPIDGQYTGGGCGPSGVNEHCERPALFEEKGM